MESNIGPFLPLDDWRVRVNGRLEAVGILGLGYVGLHIAEALLTAGYQVVGYDVDEVRIAELRGDGSVDGVSPEFSHLVGMRATSNLQDLSVARTQLICVPSPIAHDGTPNLAPLRRASSELSEILSPGMLVVLESTSFPGTLECLIRPELERSGFAAERDFFLAVSPERISPGIHSSVSELPKVVGAVGPRSAEVARQFYESFVKEVIVAARSQEAELSKLIENCYRLVNISFVNELVQVFGDLEIDVWESLELAASKPFGFHPFHPSVGVGGHCIPVDPCYLVDWLSRKTFRPLEILNASIEVNRRMPEYACSRIVSRLIERFGDGRHRSVLVLGVSYKADVADVRNSPGCELLAEMSRAGLAISFHDPRVSSVHINGVVLDGVANLDEALARTDMVVIVQAHKEYELSRIIATAPDVLDTCGSLSDHPNVWRL